MCPVKEILTWNERERLKDLLAMAYREFEGLEKAAIFAAWQVVQKSNQVP
jgi:hypothetical protein